MLFRDIDKQLLVYGVFSIPLLLASNKCAYKYVLLSKKNTVHEELVEYQSRFGGYVNRLLVIEGKYVTEKSKLTK